MDRFIRIAAYIANIVLFGFCLLVLFNSHNGRDMLFAGIGIVPALINCLALYLGPDREERRLTRQVHKARLRAELQNLNASKI